MGFPGREIKPCCDCTFQIFPHIIDELKLHPWISSGHDLALLWFIPFTWSSKSNWTGLE